MTRRELILVVMALWFAGQVGYRVGYEREALDGKVPLTLRLMPDGRVLPALPTMDAISFSADSYPTSDVYGCWSGGPWVNSTPCLRLRDMVSATGVALWMY